jgi:hypothetical protein
MSSLEERFKALREEGLADKEIVRRIFEENLDADIDEIQKMTGMAKLDIGRIKGQVSRWRKRAEEGAEEAPPAEEKELEPRQLVAQFGREGLNQIKKERLEKVLKMAPGVSGKTIPWILHKWDINARLRDDPMELYNMLHYDAGLRPNIATSIVKDVFSVEEEFADLLYQRGEQPIFFRPTGYGYGAPPTFVGWGQPPPATAPPVAVGWGYGQPPPATTPAAPTTPGTAPPPIYLFPAPTSPGAPSWIGGQPSPGPYLTREEYIKMQREHEEKSRLDRLEDRMSKMDVEQKERMSKFDRDLAGALTGLKEEIFERIDETLKPKEEKVVLPLLDEKGTPVVDEKGVARTVEVPPHMAPYILMGMRRGLTEADIRTIIREESGKPALTAEEVRRIVREEGKPTPIEEHPRLKELTEALKKTEERYNELKDAMEAEERERLKETIDRLEDRIEKLRGEVGKGEYREDTFRMLDTSVRELAGILREKRPMETAKEILVAPGVTPTRPPSERAGEEERGGVLRELGKHGLVARVIERVRR